MMSHSSSSSGYHAVGYGDQTSGAGSSSNPPLRQNYFYEVFLSFNGEDTRYGFCDHLYHKLIDRGISVFRDREALIEGQEIGQLLEAIKASKILIPIISLHYASSEWCIRELVQILKCHKPPTQLVLPIFYKVKPSDVREQKGEFGDEFQRFKARPDGESELVQDSEQAFKKVALLKGWELKINDGYEAEMVKSIVTRIFKELRAPLSVPDCLVGVEKHVEKIKEEIEAKPSNGAMFVVIHGMGGIGKTTLSKVLYNELSVYYESCSFVANIREASSHHKGMENMQKQIISDVVVDRSIQEIRHVDEGINLIQRSFKGKRILLLLDDVGSEDQVNKLTGKNNWSGLDSIIIVTTRNRDVAEESTHNLNYELTELNAVQSYELFNKHAFGTDAPCPSDLKFLARDITYTTGGLPLALEVIGSLLRGKSKGFWECTLEKLRKEPDATVEKRLKISYDGLTYQQKQIFLDIACLPIQTRDGFASDMWKSCDGFACDMWKSCNFYPEEGIKILISLSLIKIEHGMRKMHDQLRDLGRKIVLEEDRCNIGNRSRIWEGGKALEMMEQKQWQGTPNVQGLVLYASNSRSDIHCTSRQFEEMPNLRFLKMEKVRLSGDFQNCFPNLRWLQFSGPPGEIEEFGFNLKKLVILELYGVDITEHWNCWSQMKYLEVLKLYDCRSLTTTPDFSALMGLVVLILIRCSSLRKIHPSIGKLSKTLKVLYIFSCEKLEELPMEVGKIEELRILRLRCNSIREIPDSLSSRVKLQHLTFSGCRSLTRIPQSIGKLNLLTNLDLRGTGVRELPDSIGELYNLESLNMSYTPVKCLPTSIGMLTKLKQLSLVACRELESLPKLPSSLPSLHFRGDSMKTLPDFSNLTNLNELTYKDSFKRRNKALNLGNLNQLKILHIQCVSTHCTTNFLISQEDVNIANPAEDIAWPPKNIGLQLELPISLVKFKVYECQTLQYFPNLSNMRNLSEISLKNCSGLMEINGLEGAESLAHLELQSCRELSRIGDLSHSKMLKTLSLCDCEKLVEIQGLENLTSLGSLDLTGCRELESLPKLPSSLLSLYFHGDSMETLPDFSNLTNLNELTYNDSFERRNRALNLGNLNQLKILRIQCVSTRHTWNFFNLKKEVKIANSAKEMDLTPKNIGLQLELPISLVELDVYRCQTLHNFPNLSNMRNLSKISLQDCSGLMEINGLEGAEPLVHLEIRSCRKLSRIGDLSHLKMLKTLSLCDCEKLAEIQGLENLTSLGSLDLAGCRELESLPNLSSSLLSLYFHGDSMETLPDFSNLTNLNELTYNDSFERRNRALNLGNLNQLKILRIQHTSNHYNLNIFNLEEEVKIANPAKEIDLTPENIGLRLELPISLVVLEVYGCQTLHTFPNPSNMRNLSKISLRDCSGLMEINGLEGAESLVHLEIQSCRKLSRIGDLSHLKMLKTLSLCDCKRFVEIQGLENLTIPRVIKLNRM